MIIIREAIPTKLSGVSSLYISSPYNEQVFDIIKRCDKCIQNKKTYEYEVPVTSLAFLLDELTYFDDIAFELAAEEETEHLVPVDVVNYKSKPFDHQMEGIEFGLNHDSWLLLDDPGLGKTLQMIYLAQELKVQKGIEHCLIICGINSLKQNWKKEIAKHSNLSCRVIGEKISRKGNIRYAPVKDRAQELLKPLDAFFVIMNVESLRSDDIINALKKSKNKFDMIVLDECHKCANGASTQGHNLLKLKDYKYKIGMTGTLLTNTPLNAFLPLKWIGVEKGNLTNFKALYCIFGGFGGYQIVGYKNIDILKEEIDSCSLRRLKSDLKDLPEKLVMKEYIEMDPKHQQFYEDVKNGVKEECNKIELNPENVLALTTRLRQATAAPSMLTTNDIVSTKVERAVELAENIISQGHKVVIMSNFKEPVRVLAQMLKKYNPLTGHGDMKDGDVFKNIELFQNDPKYKVFIGTNSKCGTGFTLNAASYLIMLDTPWTDALTRQVEDRIHRMNNTEAAFIYRLICIDTIDELVDKIVEQKKAISEYIVDDKLDASTTKLLQNYIQDL